MQLFSVVSSAFLTKEQTGDPGADACYSAIRILGLQRHTSCTVFYLVNAYMQMVLVVGHLTEG